MIVLLVQQDKVALIEVWKPLVMNVNLVIIVLLVLQIFTRKNALLVTIVEMVSPSQQDVLKVLITLIKYKIFALIALKATTVQI